MLHTEIKQPSVYVGEVWYVRQRQIKMDDSAGSGFVSSDHSYSDSEDDALVTQPLEWRSTKVAEFFYQLDAYADEGKSAQGKKQTKERVLLTIHHLVLLLKESSLTGLLIEVTLYCDLLPAML